MFQDLCELLLYGTSDLNVVKNRMIIEATISFIERTIQEILLATLFEEFIAATSPYFSFSFLRCFVVVNSIVCWFFFLEIVCLNL